MNTNRIVTLWVFKVMAMLMVVTAHAENACVYPDKREEGSLAAHDDCGRVVGDNIQLGKIHQDNVVFDEKGLACIIFSMRDAFYLDKKGASHRVLFFDNGCDYFDDGLARGIVDKQVVLIDTTLKGVLKTGFEWVEPFDYGHAVVCNGPFVEKKVGEHTLMTGGRCGLMNKAGALVVEAKYAVGDTDAFDLYLNSHNHCPPPPVQHEAAALCHAKRHVGNMDFHRDDWVQHSLQLHDGYWTITFKERGADETFVLSLKAESAQWESLLVKEEVEAVGK